MEYGMIFIEAPKSSIALSKRVLPIVHGMVKVPRSLHFGGSFLFPYSYFLVTLKITRVST